MKSWVDGWAVPGTLPSLATMNTYVGSGAHYVNSWLGYSEGKPSAGGETDGDDVAREENEEEKEEGGYEDEREEIEKRLLDGEEKILGCFEFNCNKKFGWMTGYRLCGRYVSSALYPTAPHPKGILLSRPLSRTQM